MNKIGRPKVPEGKARVLGMSVRLTPEESKVINEGIRRSGLSRSDFARKCLLYVARNGIRFT
jgi:hypothetical protein